MYISALLRMGRMAFIKSPVCALLLGSPICLVEGDPEGELFFLVLFLNSVRWCPFPEIVTGERGVFVVT